MDLTQSVLNLLYFFSVKICKGSYCLFKSISDKFYMTGPKNAKKIYITMGLEFKIIWSNWRDDLKKK